MAFWNPTTGVIAVNTGTNPNDGTGDSIRDAFNKIDNNFSNVSLFLAAGAGASSVDFLTSNITNLTGAFANVTTVNTAALTASSVNGVNGNFTSNVTVNNLNSNTGIYNAGITSLTGNTYAANVYATGGLTVLGATALGNILVTGSIAPTANLSYDLGSPSNFFRNLYVQGLTQVNTVAASSDAGLLLLHANLSPGDIKDVGILGKYNESGANTYAFFGYQHSSDSFVYKQTPTNATGGNSVVYDGVYGNTHFGSQFLSNTTASTSTSTGALIVAGGVGVGGTVNATQIVTATANITSAMFGNVAGNLWIDGNIYSGGQPVLTPASFPYGQVYGQTVNGNANPSTSTITGALIIPVGGLGVGGNIYAGAVYTPTITANTITATIGINGNINNNYAQQPTYTSGLINSFTAGTLTYSQSLNGSGGTTFSTGGNVVLQQSGTGLWVTAGNINSVGYIGPVYGAQTNITQVGTLGTLNVFGNAIIGNITTGTISGTLSGPATTAGTVTLAAQTAITSVGTLTGLTVSGNTIVNNTLYAQGVYDNGTRVVSTSGGTGNLSITNGNITLPTIGPGAVTVGGSGYVPVITTDQYGRVVSLGNVSIAAASTTITLAGTSGTGTTSGGGTLTFASTNGVTIAVGTSYANISTPQDIRTTASPAFVAVTANITGNTTGTHFGNVVGNVSGSASTAGTATTATYVTGLTAANVQAVIGSVSTASFPTLNQNTTGTAATVTTAAQPNITSVGTLTGLTVSGAIVPNANVSVNLGSSTAWWNTVYGTAVHAQYADLAEMYTSDAEYPPGTVLIFGGEAEVTVTNIAGDTRVAGAVSTNPAYLMNTETAGVALALRGRVPVRVVGPVAKGDLLITSNHPGCAQSDGRNSTSGAAVFAKAIESSNEPGEKIIEAVIL
jgi:hypothetical protein